MKHAGMKIVLRVFISTGSKVTTQLESTRSNSPQMITHCYFLTIYLFVYLNFVSITFSYNNVFFFCQIANLLFKNTNNM